MRVVAADYIPEPRVILAGCRAWPPPPDPAQPCPVCHQGIRPEHDGYYCSVCDSLPPRREAQVRSARLGLKAQDRAEDTKVKVKAKLKSQVLRLSESERRRLWNGYRGSCLSEFPDLCNKSAIARQWLIETNMVPDWSLILDRRGRVVGHRHE